MYRNHTKSSSKERKCKENVCSRASLIPGVPKSLHVCSQITKKMKLSVITTDLEHSKEPMRYRESCNNFHYI